nr:MAG TPA: hypothetical protein [Caudoviricetes sp.]
MTYLLIRCKRHTLTFSASYEVNWGCINRCL